MSVVSSRILNLIESNRISYGDLATLTNIPKSALQRYATGETCKIPLDRVESIARALNVSPAYILGWDSKKNEFDSQETSKLIEKLENDPLKWKFLNWIANMDREELLRIERLLDAALLLPKE